MRGISSEYMIFTGWSGNGSRTSIPRWSREMPAAIRAWSANSFAAADRKGRMTARTIPLTCVTHFAAVSRPRTPFTIWDFVEQKIYEDIAFDFRIADGIPFACGGTETSMLRYEQRARGARPPNNGSWRDSDQSDPYRRGELREPTRIHPQIALST